MLVDTAQRQSQSLSLKHRKAFTFVSRQVWSALGKGVGAILLEKASYIPDTSTAYGLSVLRESQRPGLLYLLNKSPNESSEIRKNKQIKSF